MASLLPSEFRYERKFICQGAGLKEVEWMLRTHPAHFREIFQGRWVNNIYFDTFDFRHYQENLDGLRDRVKPRIRWYGELLGGIEKPVLEFKIKKGLAGRKKSFALPAMEFPRDAESRRFHALLARTEMMDEAREYIKGVRPALVNRYRRRYLLSADGRCRVTIDDSLCFYRIAAGGRVLRQPGPYDAHIILEMKYDSQSTRDMDAISNGFRFRLNRFSKYVVGVETLHA